MKINLLIRNFLGSPVRLQTEPTGPGANIEGPKYFIKFHETAPTGEVRKSYFTVEQTDNG